MEKKVRISIHLKIKTENEHLKKIWFVLYVTNQVMNFFYTFSVLFTTDEDKIIAYYLIAKNRVYDAVKEDFWEKFGEKGVSLHFFPSFFSFSFNWSTYFFFFYCSSFPTEHTNL